MRFSLLDRESNCHNYIFQYDDISIIISFNQVCVVALFSILWVVVGGWFDGMEDFDKSSLTWELLWDWMVSFPWVPALYTGIFSTGLCLWIEVLFFNILVLEERTLNNGSHFTSDFFFFSTDCCNASNVSNRNSHYLWNGAPMGSWFCMVSAWRKMGYNRVDWGSFFARYVIFILQ